MKNKTLNTFKIKETLAFLHVKIGLFGLFCTSVVLIIIHIKEERYEKEISYKYTSV
jgi:hypothetical protein